jgi:hypothetical protein
MGAAHTRRLMTDDISRELFESAVPPRPPA